jgi:hypothetical protein
MSDYFENLIARTLSPGSAVRPRLASLFEQAGEALLFAETAPLSFNEETEPTSRAAFAEREVLRVSDEKSFFELVEPVASRATPLPDRPIPPIAPSSATLLIPPLVPRAQAPGDPFANPDHQQLDNGYPADRTAGIKTPSIERGVVPEIRLENAARNDGAREDATLAVNPSRPSKVETGMTKETAPTIKITIGRIDVRAVMPTQPAPRQANERRPALSLDDYLKQRSGGKA